MYNSPKTIIHVCKSSLPQIWMLISAALLRLLIFLFCCNITKWTAFLSVNKEIDKLTVESDQHFASFWKHKWNSRVFWVWLTISIFKAAWLLWDCCFNSCITQCCLLWVAVMTLLLSFFHCSAVGLPSPEQCTYQLFQDWEKIIINTFLYFDHWAPEDHKSLCCSSFGSKWL